MKECHFARQSILKPKMNHSGKSCNYSVDRQMKSTYCNSASAVLYNQFQMPIVCYCISVSVSCITLIVSLVQVKLSHSFSVAGYFVRNLTWLFKQASRSGLTTSKVDPYAAIKKNAMHEYPKLARILPRFAVKYQRTRLIS